MFYKLDTINQQIVCAPNAVYGPGYTLSKNDPDDSVTKTGITDGWKWFTTDTEAYLYFGLVVGDDPWTISPMQAKMALLQAGLLDDVETFIAEASRDIQIAWEYASEFKRTSPLLLSLSELLGLTSTQLDELFALAKGIEV